MRAIQADEFKKMAQTVVDSYLSESVPLTESLIKSALDNALNPDQIRNLVQLANTMAHLTLFDQKAGDDKIVEFDPADPDVVIKRVYTDGEPACSSGPAEPMRGNTDMFGDFDDITEKIRAMLRDEGASPSPTSPTSPPVETPETMPAVSPSPDAVSPQKRQMLIIKIRKVASELETRKHAAAQQYRDELDKLAADFAKLYGPRFEDFEKDALALRGEKAFPIVADIRNCLRMPAVPADNMVGMSKVARVVDSKTPALRTLDKLIKLADDWSVAAAAYQHIVDEVGDVL